MPSWLDDLKLLPQSDYRRPAVSECVLLDNQRRPGSAGIGSTPVADTIKSEIKESLIPATEEMTSVVIKPHGSDLAGLLRRFPEIADLLRAATGLSRVEPTAELPESEADSQPLDETDAIGGNEVLSLPEATATLARGRALDICRKFEADLKHRLSPRIEDIMRDIGEPERSALLTMLVAAELRFRVRQGERPSRQDYHRRFPDHGELIEAVFVAAIGPERIGAFMVDPAAGRGQLRQGVPLPGRATRQDGRNQGTARRPVRRPKRY